MAGVRIRAAMDDCQSEMEMWSRVKSRVMCDQPENWQFSLHQFGASHFCFRVTKTLGRRSWMLCRRSLAVTHQVRSCSGLACFRRNDAISETGVAQALRAGKRYASLTVEGTSQSPSPILRASIKPTNRNGFGPTQEYFSGLPIVQW